jgi:uncharacterized hydrophobic protein (TIGR00271 family)
MLTLFDTLSEKDKADAIEWLIRGSTPRQDFFLMIVLSVLMATFGLLIDSSAVVIGSMLIAPMLYPVLGLSMGIIMSDMKLVSRSFYTVFKSVVFGIIAAFAAAAFFSSQQVLTSEIVLRTQPSLPYIAIAIIAGLAASFAMVKPHLNETLPGIAISVALIPPLAVVGIGLARFDWNIISKSFVLFMVNIIGIVFASMVTFSLMNLYVKRGLAAETALKEDLKVEKEKEEAKNKH